MRWILGFAPLGLLAFVVVGCGSGGGDASTVSLAELAAEQEHYDGDTVAVVGQVRPFADPGQPTYYVLEDTASNRVMLLPADAAAPHDGATVCVTGRFEFREGLGRTLTIDRIEDRANCEA